MNLVLDCSTILYIKLILCFLFSLLIFLLSTQNGLHAPIEALFSTFLFLKLIYVIKMGSITPEQSWQTNLEKAHTRS